MLVGVASALAGCGKDVVMEEQEQTDFFISYNHRDGQWAEWIGWELEQAGYTCIMQAWDFVPGANFVAEMHHALLRCHRVIAIVSANYLTSAFVTAEWTSAYADDPDGKRRKLRPIRVEDIEIGGLLKAIVYVDLVGKDEEAARRAIFAAAEVHRRKPGSAPIFPNPQLRVDFPQTNTAANSSVVRFALVLTGTVDELSRPLVEAIVKHLRQFAPDSQLTLEQIQRGSLVLAFRSARVVFSRLQMWFTSETSGHSPLLLGMTVKRMFLLPPETARPVSERLSLGQTERGRFSDAAVLYFALDEVLGPDFLCTLAAYLNYEDDGLRKATLRLLLDLAYFSDATLPLVLSSLASRGMKFFIADELQCRGAVGYAAVAALVALRPAPEEAVRTVARLGYERPARVAADALAVMEFQGSPAYHHLVSSLLERLISGKTRASDDASIERVVWSLSRIARSAAPAYHRIWAIRSLALLHRMNSSVKHLLRVVVMDDRSEMEVCVAGIQALVETGDVGADLADRLLERVKKTDSTNLPDATVDLLAILRSPNGDMLDGLISLLSADDASVRRAAARALGSVGYNAALIIPALTHCLSDEDTVVRENVEAALQRIRRDTSHAALNIEELLTAEDDIIRKRALENLRDLREDEQ
jgi:hypothetical protein